MKKTILIVTVAMLLLATPFTLAGEGVAHHQSTAYAHEWVTTQQYYTCENRIQFRNTVQHRHINNNTEHRTLKHRVGTCGGPL